MAGRPLIAIHRLELNIPVSRPGATDARPQIAFPMPGLA
jgi:hypothetical protein